MAAHRQSAARSPSSPLCAGGSLCGDDGTRVTRARCGFRVPCARRILCVFISLACKSTHAHLVSCIRNCACVCVCARVYRGSNATATATAQTTRARLGLWPFVVAWRGEMIGRHDLVYKTINRCAAHTRTHTAKTTTNTSKPHAR